MLAEDVLVIDADSRLWQTLRPVVDAALRLEQNDTSYKWHGWSKREIDDFLQHLPTPCSLVACVWDTLTGKSGKEREVVTLGSVCEVVKGEVRTVRTIEALTGDDLPSVEQLEPGYESALEIMRAARIQVAPVAWALFTDKATWDAWLFGENASDGEATNKGDLLTSFAHQGRCVLMGSQTTHHHP